MKFKYKKKSYYVDFDLYRVYMNNLPILIPRVGLVEVYCTRRDYSNALYIICADRCERDLSDFRMTVLPVARQL